MALASHTLCFLLLLLLGPAWQTVGSTVHSLCLNFTVTSRSPPGQLCGEAQGSVDGNPFLQYDCENNRVTPLGPLGDKVKATKTWTHLTQKMGIVESQLRMIMPDIKLERNTTRVSPTKTPETGQSNWMMILIFVFVLFVIIVIGSIIGIKVKPSRRRSGATGDHENVNGQPLMIKNEV
ncbi:retinoic acid early transcript 1E-like [Talpa occidentalis]|uniref:retinoic acid early transcript 1E-like n=1 Tax=Talpa occidentalis TaxID=50954 RepID=UPI00188FEA80|nr:retinoic acid early transcript 1E-like [Talpa occidentalis]